MPTNSSMRWRRVVLSFLGAAGFLLLGGAGFATLKAMRPHPERREESARVFTVETEKIQRRDVTEKIVAYGTARALKSTRVSSRVSGQVAWMLEGLRPGLRVEAGQTLLSLDERTFEAEIKRRKGVLEQARAEARRLATSERAASEKKTVAERDLQLSQDDYERAKELIGRNVISTRERDQKEMAYRAAERSMIDAQQRYDEVASEIDRANAVVEQSEASLRQAELDLEFATVKAPFGGVIQSVSVEKGEVVAAAFSAQPLVEIVATGEVEVPVQLPASRVGDIKPGQAVTLRLPAREIETWTGVIARVAPRIDEATRSIEVYVLVKNDEGDGKHDLLPGAFVAAELSGRVFPNAVAVPRRAVVDGVAFVADRGGDESVQPVARERQVKVKAVANGLALVESGLDAGDELILTNLDTVYDKAPVKPLLRGEGMDSGPSREAAPADALDEADLSDSSAFGFPGD